MKKITNYLKDTFVETRILIRSIPALLMSFFVISIVGMNLLANKSINFGVDWIALDCGIFMSWMCFLTMDVIVKRFGQKAANIVTVVGLLINLLISFIFIGISYIPGFWSQSYVEGSEAIINSSLDLTFRGSWFVILGSSIAFVVSGILNNFLNYLIGKIYKNKSKEEKMSFTEFALRAYVSTAIAQFVDNLLFALIVSLNFFGWNITQCFTCAAVGALFELVVEIVFSPIGYKILRKMELDNAGADYLKLIEAKK